MKYNPHPYQQRGTDLIVAGNSIMLAMEMGLGKTVTTLTGVQQLVRSGKAKNVLVIAPLRVAKFVWPDELRKWDHLDLSYIPVLGTEKQRIAALKTKADVYIINVENIKWLVDLVKSVDNWPFDTVVIDESSKFKAHNSKRFRALRRVRRCIHRVIELTGTPTPNGYMDLWSQINLLDRGERLGTAFTAFKRRYFQQTDYMGYRWELRPGAERRILAAISNICVSMRAQDYLDMPDLVFNNVVVELPAAAREVYTRMERDMLVTLNSGDVEAANMAVVTGKCLQTSNGAMYTDDEGRWEQLHDAKLDALEEILTEAGDEPVILAYQYRHDLERLQQRFPHLRTLDEPGVIDTWNEGEVPLLCCHPASAGHGLNLQHGGHIVVWFGVNWSLELYEQFNARLHRQGQKDTVIVHHLVSRDTLDFEVLDRLASKKSVQDVLKHFLRRKAA